MYAKLYAQVVASSLTENETIDVRGVFFMMMAMSDKSGNVPGVDKAIARLINVPLETFQRAVERLMLPDPTSQTPDFEGRRLLPLEGSPGYFIVNYVKYAGIVSDAHRREYFRTKKKESRARLSGGADAGATEKPVNGSGSTHSSVSSSPASAPLLRSVGANHPKSLQEVEVACEMLGFLDPNLPKAFFDHYEGRAKEGPNGEKIWFAGDNVIGDWRRILSTWNTRDVARKNEQSVNPKGGRKEIHKEPGPPIKLKPKFHGKTTTNPTSPGPTNPPLAPGALQANPDPG